MSTPAACAGPGVTHAFNFVLSGGVGADFGVGSGAAGPRIVLVFPTIQWPVPLGRIAEDANNGSLLHRFVLDAEFVVGPFPSGSNGQFEFRLRIGSRLAWHPNGGFVGLVAGLGTTIECYPLLRPSVSPELGVRLGHVDGSHEVPRPIATLTLRGDFWFAGDDATRLLVLAGVTFF